MGDPTTRIKKIYICPIERHYAKSFPKLRRTYILSLEDLMLINRRPDILNPSD